MARLSARIPTPIGVEEAWARMSAVERIPEWDPATVSCRRVGTALGLGSQLDVVTRFGRRTIAARYRMTVYEPPRRLVMEAVLPNGTGLRDEVMVNPAASGCVVTRDAHISLRGARRLADPLVQLRFSRIGARALPLLRRYLGAG